ncbi:hypothetical protein F5148DRAFT_146669 [Russula earlei]|uniref:Uncharacterized protein n=1 Tax=Russula earlei TaxID=71964 RepID=A0ACC0U771_9AGAM|nr:hypothetical protein F5148DRAFT_146669 [Russula earlei]
MASPTPDSRNLHRIGTELGFLEDSLALQPENKPEHLRAWVVWLCDMDKQWSEYRSILKSVGFPEAPTGELLEREKKALGRKKEAEIIYDRLRKSVEGLKSVEQHGRTPGSTEDADYIATVNDSTDAEGEIDTTTSVPPIAAEKPNGEKVQKTEAQVESIVKASPVPEDHDELQEGELADGVRRRPVPCDLCARRGRSCVGKEGRACLPCKERRVACSHVAKPRKDVTAGTPESDAQVPDTRTSHPFGKRPRPPPPPADVRPAAPSSSTGPAAQAGTRTLKRKVSRGPGIRTLSASGSKRVRVDRNEDSEGDPFGSDEEEFMEAARAARTSTGWERGAEAENFPSTLSTEDGARILERIRSLEEKARDIVGEISALKTYFLH